MKPIILLTLILLVGCTTQTEEEKEEICETDCLSDGWQYGTWIGLDLCNCYNETMTITINKTIKEPCNVTYVEDGCQYKKSYVLDLIRRISFLEKYQDDLIIKEIECNNTIYKGKLEMCERDLEEVEDELEDCEDELCEHNSSWC